VNYIRPAKIPVASGEDLRAVTHNLKYVKGSG